MKVLCIVVSVLALQVSASADISTPESQVGKTVEAFYAAFTTHSFDRAADFTTEDWNHINPGGGWTQGRDDRDGLCDPVRMHCYPSGFAGARPAP